jgi:hypothetical protein
MRINKNTVNNIKNGRIWIYLDNKYEKSITVEWSLKINPFNLSLELDGQERRYKFNFWCIWVFYISFSNIFKYYPKGWNSYSNNKMGGYLDQANRIIGISQYDWGVSIYFWHDGEYTWYKDKDTKIYYKYINLLNILCGDWCYHTLDENNAIEYLDLPEKTYKVNVQYRFWNKKWKRFYMKIFNQKGKTFSIKSDIKYPTRKWTNDDIQYGIAPEDLESSMNNNSKSFVLKQNKNISDAVNMYKDIIIKKRSVESENWVPSEFKKIYQREIKLKRILDGDIL